MIVSRCNTSIIKRNSDWWLSIIPFLLGLCYVLILTFRIPFEEGILMLLLFFVTISSTAAFGYLLNDFTDRVDDKRAGKSNVAAGISGSKILLFFLALIVFALVPWFFLPKAVFNISLYSFQICLLLAYSVPPIRLKRFSIPAVILDALYNSVVPILVIISTFVLISIDHVAISPVIGGLTCIWAFLKGLRNILLHQVQDRKNDKRASLRTFVLQYGPLWTIRFIKRVTLPAESLLFITIICVLSFSRFPFLWILPLLFGLYVFFILRLWERHMPWWKKETGYSALYLINDLYEEWLPVAALIYLPFLDPWYMLLWPLHVLLFNRTFRKFYKNFKLNQKNFADFNKYLARDKYEAISSIPPLQADPCLSDDNKVVHGLWIGNRLSVIELLTIRSFLANGHDFHLWMYEEIQNLPEGVTIRDANQIIPQSEIIVRKFNDPVTGVGKGSVGAPFSDLFRYKLLYEHGGWWVDMDVTCLKPLQFEEPYFFRDHLLLDVIGNVMKCPKGSKLMLQVYNEVKATCDENTIDWLLPNKILNKHIKELDLLRFRQKGISNNDEWPETRKYIRSLKKIPDHWHFIHWSNEEWRMIGLEKEHLRLKKTTLGFLIEKYEIQTVKTNYLKMLKNDLRLAKPFKLSLPLFVYAEMVMKPFIKFYWYFYGHLKWWYNWSRKTLKY